MVAINNYTGFKSESEEYLTLLYGKAEALRIRKYKSGLIRGSNNPAYQHGGKYSPFSKKFVGKASIEETKAKAKQSKKDHPELQPTKIEYYLAQGLTESDAKLALKERQSTFSLNKCIEDHGVLKGQEIFEARQAKWQNTLNNKPQEEIDRINKLKSTKINYNTLWSLQLDVPGIFYILKLADNQIKIGITSKDTTQSRYSTDISNMILKEHRGITINHAFMIEQLIKKRYNTHVKKSDYGEFGWTEVLNGVNIDEIVMLTNAMLESETKTLKVFNKTFNKNILVS